jgi:hypothetical protein
VTIGHLIVDAAEAAKNSDRASTIAAFVVKTDMLRECTFAHLDVMLIACMSKQGFTLVAADVATADPAALTAEEAATIGRGFAATLRLSATPREAVDTLLSKYVALGVMAHRHAWFRPMLETIAKRLVAVAPLGLPLRLAIGVVFSIAAMLSDINIVVQMLRRGRIVGACVLLGLILASLAVQILIVLVQNSHRGWRVVAWECFLVLSLCKGGMDAVRVAGGDEQVVGSPMDPLAEMAFCKLAGMVFQSIPGSVLQAFFLASGGWTTAALVSIVLSCLSTASTVTMLAYDIDTSAAKRAATPEFYGCAVCSGSTSINCARCMSCVACCMAYAA